MNRRQARQAALCMIFDYSFHSDEPLDELLELYIENFKDNKDMSISEELRTDDYFTKVYFGVISNIPKIDSVIERCSKKWNISRISRVAISIIRLSLYEIMFIDDIPTQVSINEAVELAKKFDSEESYTFINGVLGAAERLLSSEEYLSEQRDGIAKTSSEQTQEAGQ